MKKCNKFLLGVGAVSALAIGASSAYFYHLTIKRNGKKPRAFRSKKNKVRNEVFLKSSFVDEVPHLDRYIVHQNLKLHALDYNQGSDTYVIVVHGYHDSAKDMGLWMEQFYAQGYNVLGVDCRGHGESEGDYVGMGYHDRLDVIAWVSELVKQDENIKIVLFGVSMGAATVMNASGEKLVSNVKAVIEDCGYTSPSDIFEYQMKMMYGIGKHPILDVSSLITRIRAGYSFKKGPIKQLRKTKLPMLFIHGSKDKFVPFEMLDKLYNSSNAYKEKLIIQGAGHALSSSVDPDLYWQTVSSFLEQQRNK